MHIDGCRQLRGLLSREGIVVAPGCHDALGARIAQAQGLEAIYVSGNATSASRLGRPDVGLITQTEMVAHARGMVAAVDLPVISDADTGYGDALSVARTVHEFEAAGVAAIHIEDQALPKKCGAMPGVRLVSREEAIARVSAAVEARRNPDFVVIARTDALATGDYEGAVWRARAFRDAGADLVMVEDVRSRQEVAALAKDLQGIPLMTDILEFWPWTQRPVAELGEMGYKIAIFCLATTLAYARAAETVMKSIQETGTTMRMAGGMYTQAEYENVLGLQDQSAAVS